MGNSSTKAEPPSPSQTQPSLQHQLSSRSQRSPSNVSPHSPRHSYPPANRPPYAGSPHQYHHNVSGGSTETGKSPKFASQSSYTSPPGYTNKAALAARMADETAYGVATRQRIPAASNSHLAMIQEVIAKGEPMASSFSQEELRAARTMRAGSISERSMHDYSIQTSDNYNKFKQANRGQVQNELKDTEVANRPIKSTTQSGEGGARRTSMSNTMVGSMFLDEEDEKFMERILHEEFGNAG
ncbi:uncharacterized protein BJ171DRAFT_570298 [Polychytrium aggregatum]|uniref:uncharacterized protein n=1 Tax=Polychytrium aggregatum TaxID=110093 RepID=UPI0022FE5164|nr:uncharacterized protein BJ171DRAFT_570298 [Polychytrium aggregatum]KAI9199733.1 hypothetical protein BJ171DRAFT_570298 [Polychytrium aggregatum]